MSEQKLQYIHGYYVGREFFKKGTKSDGSEWTIYKIKIKKDLEDQYATNLSCFSSAKGFDTLEEGEFYTVGYEESEPKYNEKAKKEIKYKTAKFITVSNPDEVSNTQQQTLDKPVAKQAPEMDSKLDPNKEMSEEEMVFQSEVYSNNESLDEETNKAIYVGKWIMTFAPAAAARAIKQFENL